MSEQSVITIEEYLADLSVTVRTVSEIGRAMSDLVRANSATDERVVSAALSDAEHRLQEAGRHLEMLNEHLNMAKVMADLTDTQREVLAARLGLDEDSDDA